MHIDRGPPAGGDNTLGNADAINIVAPPSDSSRFYKEVPGQSEHTFYGFPAGPNLVGIVINLAMLLKQRAEFWRQVHHQFLPAPENAETRAQFPQTFSNYYALP